MSNNLQPEIRFKGFSDDWNTSLLSSFGLASSGVALENEFVIDGKYKVISIGSYSKDSRYVDQGLRINRTKKTSTRILNKNDLTMVLNDKTSTGDIIGRVLLIDQDNTYTFNQRTQRISINQEIFNPLFLYQLLNSEQGRLKIFKLAQGNTQIYVNWSSIKNIEYHVAGIVEQQQIGDFFQSIDKDIALQEEKLNKTKNLKKAMLEKMFPKEGSKQPEVRFDGFSGDWEEKILQFGVSSLHGGVSIAPEDYQNTGVATIPKGAINDSGLADIDTCKFVSEDFAIKYPSALVREGDLITSLRDLVPSAPNLGRIVEIPKSVVKSYLMPQGVYQLVLNGAIERNFLITYSNLDSFRQLIFQEKNGTTQVHLRNQNFLNLSMNIPNLKEQEKIGEYFKGLDNAIALQAEQLEKLKNIKKAYLAKMFV